MEECVEMTRNLQAICLPGGVAPASQRYAPLAAATSGRADLHLKDLEVQRDGTPGRLLDRDVVN
jgi:hypothetical protein